MARFISTFLNPTSDPNSPTGGQTLDALMQRQKLLQAAQLRNAEPQVIQSPWQGAAQIGGTIANALQQGRVESQETAGRTALSQAMAKIDPTTGALPPEAMATISQLDPELGQKYAMDMIAARRAERERQLGWEHEAEINKRELAETQAATAETRQYEAGKPLTDIAKLNADLAAGRIDKPTYDTAMATATTPKTDPVFAKEQDLRKEYNTNPVVKNLPTIQNALERIQTGAKDTTPAGDMALIYGFMKLQDPESVVREGEYASAENARGVEASVLNLYEKIRNGARLTPQQRQEFTALAGKQYADYSAQLGDVNKRYTGIATQYGIAPERVLVTPKTYEQPPAATPPPAEAAPPPTAPLGTLPPIVPPAAAAPPPIVPGTGMPDFTKMTPQQLQDYIAAQEAPR